MTMKQLDRLLFEQGNQCFFCRKPLNPADASVEHLVASANGGNNSEENCVACCKKLNALLGSKSLKEKMQIVLNQRGSFRCPEDVERERLASVAKATAPIATSTPKSRPPPPPAAKPKANPQPQAQAKQQPKPQSVPQKQLPALAPKTPTPLSVNSSATGLSAQPFAAPTSGIGPLRDVACPTCKRTFSAATTNAGYRCQICDTVFRY
jgi:hypothetical protein